MPNTSVTPAPNATPKVDGAALVKTIEDAVGPISQLVADHSSGTIHTVAIDIEEFAPEFEAFLNRFLGI